MSQAAAPTSRMLSGRPTRWAMFRQAFVGFATVLGCYWVYWFLAVPLIEPNLDERVTQTVSDEQIERARGDITVRQRELARFFNPEDWEAKGPKFINSGQMRVLFDKLSTRRDGTLELEPCTLLFFPRENPQDQGQPVIMRTAKATLMFDKPVDMRSVDFKDLKFLGGAIEGAVRIVQRESAPGKGDDLEITTSGVKMDAQRIYTPEAVQFRMGRSRGFGRDLEIRLASSESGARGTALRGMSVSTVELKRDVRMRLEMGDGPLAGPPAADVASAPAEAAPQEETIEIKCAGSFVFDMPKYAASFADSVDVFRIVPQGESDQLNCQLLTVYFMRSGEAPEGTAAKSEGQRSAASQVRLIEARGNPVTIRSPSRAMYARCNGLDYLPGGPGEPGAMVAFGPGVLQGQMPVGKDGRPTGEFAASWARELRFEPDGSLHRAALHGAATINIGTMGEIKADEVFAWLSKKLAPPAQAVAHVARFQPVDPAAQPVAQPRQQPAAPKPGAIPGGEQWQIERLLARKYQDAGRAQTQDVTINSPQFHATTSILEAVVNRPQQVAPAAGGPAQAEPERRQQPANPDEKFFLSGRSVRIELVPQGEQLAIAAATVEQAAELKQMKFAAGLEKRTLLVRGDRLHVVDAQSPGTRITITGQPGYVEAEGMSLWGPTIDVDKAANRLWITGPGKLMLPMNQDLDGKRLARPQELTVHWQTGMNFQSDTAVFTGAVVARSAQQVVNTETLEAKLNRAVDFARPELNENRPDQRLDLAALRTRGWTFLEGRQLDETGAQTSFSQMGVNDLSLDRASGEIAGNGPGWVRHVAKGAPPSLDPAAAAGRQQAAAPAPPPNDDQLTYLYVTFRRGLAGNLNSRAVKFFDQTKTLYGPVTDWNQQLSDKDLDGLGDTGMVLLADALEVREMGKRPESKRGFFELDATGHVTAEGQKFTAHGNRITFVEQSDQLSLRGQPAELFRDDDQSGQRREMRADMLQYWVKDRRVKIEGASSVDIPLPPPKRTGAPAAPAAATQAPLAPSFSPQSATSPGAPLPR